MNREASVPAPRMWMFDVDGVLVNLASKRAEGRLIKLLETLLQQGELITFNSARAPLSIVELVLSLLNITDKAVLQQIIVVGEKAGAWAVYSLDGNIHVTIDAGIVIPAMIETMITKLVQERAFVDVVEIEGGKHTMLSVVARPGVSIAAFQEAQAQLIPLLQHSIHVCGCVDTWKIAVTGNSIEIETKEAGKDKGAQKIIQWCYAQGMQLQDVRALGDSVSDIAMAEALHQKNIPVEFIFTGVQALPKTQYPFSVVQTQRKYELGAIDYLEHHQEHPSSLQARWGGERDDT